VLIATGFNFPDALAGNYLAGQDNAPILLVNKTDPVPSATLTALQALKAKNVVILGGTDAVGADVATTLAGTTSTSSGAGNLNVTRIGGLTRYDTAEMVNEAPGATAVGLYQGKKTAFLARGDDFPDALGAGPVADYMHFPVILTSPTTLSPQASATISALGIQQLLVLGGTAAIATSVEQAADTNGVTTLQRFPGVDRSDTSRLLADYALTNFGFVNSKFTVASGDEAFGGADALASGPFSAHQGPVPTLVTNTVTDPGQVVTFASEHSTTESQGFAAGGTVPLPDSTLALISAKITGPACSPGGVVLASTTGNPGSTVSGTVTNPGSVTALTVSGCGLGTTTTTGGTTTTTPVPVTFNSTTGAFSITIPASQANGSCVLTFTSTLTGGTTQVTQIPFTVNSGAQTAQAYTVTPSSPQNANVAGGTTQNITYTVSGIPTGVPVDIELFACTNAPTTPGSSTFPNSSNPGGTGNVAVPGSAGGATITQVNGTGVTGAQLVTNQAATSAGTLTFQVTSSTVGCVVPVVFSNADGDNLLNLGTNNQPTEPFGVGGSANFQNLATAGPITAGTVSAPSSTQFTENGLTYNYGPNDTYQLMVGGTCTASTYAVFQQRLSTGDQVTGTYNPPPGGPGSTFCLNDIAPAAPTAVTTSAGTGTNTGAAGIQVNFNDSATPTVASYNIYRATAIQPTITGGTVTCPTLTNAGVTTSPQTPPPASSGYAKIGSVTDTTPTVGSSGTYTFFDSTATVPPTTTPTNPEYCYVVTSVDATGQEGNPSAISGPTAATASSGVPAFTSAAAGASTVQVTYNQAINPATVDSNGSDFTVTYTVSNVTTADPVTAASGSGSTATITVANAIPSGATVVVTAQNGTMDLNTVCASGSTTNCQAPGSQVQTVAGAAAPAFASSSASHTTDTITVVYNEPVNCTTVGPADYTVQSPNGTTDAATTATCVSPSGGFSSSVVLGGFGTPLVLGNTYTVTSTGAGPADSLGHVQPSGQTTSGTVA